MYLVAHQGISGIFKYQAIPVSPPSPACSPRVLPGSARLPQTPQAWRGRWARRGRRRAWWWRRWGWWRGRASQQTPRQAADWNDHRVGGNGVDGDWSTRGPRLRCCWRQFSYGIKTRRKAINIPCGPLGPLEDLSGVQFTPLSWRGGGRQRPGRPWWWRRAGAAPTCRGSNPHWSAGWAAWWTRSRSPSELR